MPKTHVYLGKNYTGVYANYILEHIFCYDNFWSSEQEKTGYMFIDNLGDIGKEYLDADEVWIIGVPYWKSYKHVIADMLAKGRVVRHAATYGEVMDFEGDIISKVYEKNNPLIDLPKFAREREVANNIYGISEGDMVDAMDIALSIDAYHRYDTGSKYFEKGLELILLMEVFGTDIEEVTNKTLSIARLMKHRMEEYVVKAIETAQVRGISGNGKNMAVVVLYAERYVNEIAHKVIDYYLNQNGLPVIVMVGRHTSGSRVFSIRTSEGVSAADVSRILGDKARGKERAATLYLPSEDSKLTDSISNYLSDHLVKGML